ncbi:tRNA threonylcarbamoyladenosine dehydratase [Hydromonas duriensis]|uniref:tRNA A37 threonylcarbamoyladenosine dehydratase n=1 Tax=Hydromonas duriensis TaxID=1527608 RepID=A0A4R6YA21_9BURK|nr:tRNA threonylcarbamoyladenosine dehydratase [Hydromonas duriensis]TDR32317.1 tRNA A37 threonylcarbamoyladenosine dehydratase [Hydromonas duriensis]
MSETINRRFSGLDRLYGDGAAQRLSQAHVCVVGVGGVGSWAVEALARCGVGQLTLIDADHVVESNVNRQIQALEPSLGQAKITALAQRIALINSQCVVHQVDDFIDDSNLELIPTAADVVLDCTDQVKAKLAMLLAARQRRQAFLCCGAAGGKQDATRIVQADLALSIQDPILAKVRSRLRSHLKKSGANMSGCAHKLGVPVLFSDEAVRYPAAVCDANEASSSGVHGLNCAGFGSSVMVTASFGMAAAQWAVAQILKGKS